MTEAFGGPTEGDRSGLILSRRGGRFRPFLVACLGLAPLISVGSPPVPAAYPERHIRVIVHVPPGAGGGTDIMARLLLKYVGRELGTNFIVENYFGAGGQVGYTALATAEPDGYTIGTITTTSIVTHELTRKGVAYRLEDSFIPIARVVMDPSGLFVPSGSRFESIGELVACARENKGELNCGGTSLWGAHHVHCKLLEQQTGARLNYIPFDGASEVRNNLLGNHIDIASGGVSEFEPLVRSGKVKALVVAGEKRAGDLPDTPTYRELGYDLVAGSDRGFAAPAGTPREYVELLSQTIGRVVADPAFLADADKIGIAASLAYLDSEGFGRELSGLRRTMMELVAESRRSGR